MVCIITINRFPRSDALFWAMICYTACLIISKQWAMDDAITQQGWMNTLAILTSEKTWT